MAEHPDRKQYQPVDLTEVHTIPQATYEYRKLQVKLGTTESKIKRWKHKVKALREEYREVLEARNQLEDKGPTDDLDTKLQRLADKGQFAKAMVEHWKTRKHYVEEDIDRVLAHREELGYPQ